MSQEKGKLAEVLDRYREIEGWNAEYIEAWINVTDDDGLRGGLRSILRREQAHATELTARLKELGGSERSIIPAEQRAQTNAFYASREAGDLAKLGALVDIFRDPENLLGFVIDAVRDRGTDGETRELLRTILDDEKATIDWVRGAHAMRTAKPPAR